jgi:hypothetical protein
MTQKLIRIIWIIISSTSLLTTVFLPDEAGAQIYFSADEHIKVLQTGESVPDVLIDADAYGLVVDTENDKIYWSESVAFGSEIKSANLDGSGITVINDDSESARGLTIDYDNQHIYWVDLVNDGSIMRSGLNGENVTELIAGQSDGVTNGILDIAIDSENGHIYWVKFGAVMRADLDGTNIEPFSEFAAYKQPSSVDVNPTDGYVYWVDSSSDDILRAPMNSGIPETLIDAEGPAGISVDVENGLIYWLDDFFTQGTGQLNVAKLDGTDMTVITETSFTRGAIFGAGWEMATSNEIENKAEQPSIVQLSQNFPNPFNPNTVIEFQLKKAMNVTLTVHNSLGQQVAILANRQRHSAGIHELAFDASNLSSGLYFYRLQTGEVSLTKKMTLLK